jgi:hypothetical protein
MLVKVSGQSVAADVSPVHKASTALFERMPSTINVGFSLPSATSDLLSAETAGSQLCKSEDA